LLNSKDINLLYLKWVTVDNFTLFLWPEGETRIQFGVRYVLIDNYSRSTP
ncbi:MAG: hypothetical protein ACI9P5_004195, partial [Saprospiraceae bacterium]